MDKIVYNSGIQQVGIGVTDVYEAWKWYREHFGVNVPIFDEKAVADIMLPYTGGKKRERHAVLAINMNGGGGFEIWQHTGMTSKGPSFEILPGDLGIFACKIKCANINDAYQFYTEKGTEKTPLYQDERNQKFFYIKDPYKNIFQIVESQQWFRQPDKKMPMGGVFGAVIGTDDMDKAIAFYSSVLGYDQVVYDKTSTFSDFDELGTPETQFRRVLLTHSAKRVGAFSELLGTSEIELVQAINRQIPIRKIFEDRIWGELGFIQICYDIKGMEALKEKCESLGWPFTVDSRMKEAEFGMGDAAGHFAYNEDPSGTLVEYVETLKVPIFKKLGIFLHLNKFPVDKPLPRWMLGCLKLMKVK